MRRRTQHVVLVGLPATGKTTVGFSLARRLNRPFFDANNHPETLGDRVDIASAVDHDAGREWLKRITAASNPAVIAAPWAGVGAIIDGDRSDDVTGDEAWVILLDSATNVLQERLVSDHADPELIDRIGGLSGEDEARLADLRRVATVVRSTDEVTADELVDDLAAIWHRHCAAQRADGS